MCAPFRFRGIHSAPGGMLMKHLNTKTGNNGPGVIHAPMILLLRTYLPSPTNATIFGVYRVCVSVIPRFYVDKRTLSSFGHAYPIIPFSWVFFPISDSTSRPLAVSHVFAVP